MQPKAYREGKAVGDLKETVFKAYIVQIRRLGGNLGLFLLQSTGGVRNPQQQDDRSPMIYNSYYTI